MKRLARVLATMTVVGAMATVLAQQVPDVAGPWTRQPGNNAIGLGPAISIEQSGNLVTITPLNGPSSRYTADGIEKTEDISPSPCERRLRITKTIAGNQSITITTWIVKSAGCPHGQTDLFRPTDEEDAPPPRTTAFGANLNLGPTRTLESIIVIARDGDRLTIDSTRAGQSGTPSVTRAGYRRR